MTTRFLRIVTANIKAYPAMPPRDVWDDLTTIADKLDPDLLATQEMWFPRYRAALRRALPLSHYGHSTPRSVAGTCVSWYAGLGKRIETGARLLHGPIPGVCAFRRIVWVGLDLGDGVRLAFASTHPTPSAFSHRFSGAKKARVRAKWDRGMTRLNRWIRDMQVAGYTHIAVGLDANANAVQLYGAITHPITLKSHGIDHVLLYGKWDVDKSGHLAEHNSDHAPFYVIARPVP